MLSVLATTAARSHGSATPSRTVAAQPEEIGYYDTSIWFSSHASIRNESKVTDLIESLTRPTLMCPTKARVGTTDSDGGYVICKEWDIPRVLEAMGEESCLVYSFGIKDDYDVENQLVAQGCEVPVAAPLHRTTASPLISSPNVQVHGFDPTVDREDDMQFHFHKVGLGARDEVIAGLGPVQNMSTLLGEYGRASTRRLSVFDCDIEGSEWASFSAMSDAQWKSMDLLVLELHFTDDTLDDAAVQRYWDALAPLRKHFHLFHSHVNNCGGYRRNEKESKEDRVFFPNLFELSLINKAVAAKLGFEAARALV